MSPPATPPRILILRAPGTNCERETAHAFAQERALPQIVHVNHLQRTARLLDQVDGVVIPGGFAYGDELGAGTVLGTILRTNLLRPLEALVERGGVILGICNGFQALVKAGLLPGDAGDPAPPARSVALATNLQNRYEDRWVTLEVTANHCAFLPPRARFSCPVAHGEGRFLPQRPEVLQDLEARGLVALRYVRPRNPPPVPSPHNPNGSAGDVAGITDETGRILGLMPHPERNQFPWQDPRFHRGAAPPRPEGLLVFRTVLRYLRAR